MTETYNPILDMRRVSRWQILSPVLKPPAAVAYAYVRDNIVKVVDPGQLYSWRTNDIRYDIDIGRHTISFDCSLPSSQDADQFNADVQMICFVADPQIVVQRKIIDACAAIKPPVTRL